LRLILNLADTDLPRPNISLGAVCLALDMGLEASTIDEVMAFLGQVNFRANAAEGAAQAPEVLRRIPEAFIEDRCVPPRRSPRAEAGDQEA
jgi:hypothetical protein